MFLGFQPYDDEGLYLSTIRDYLGGQPLMTPYVPLYGPFYYEVVGGIFKLLGTVPTHDAGRWITIAFWLLASGVGGFAVWRLTRNVWLAIAGQCLAFIPLAALALEPTSTYGLSILLELCLVTLATFTRGSSRIVLSLMGGVVAALFLIKVNVGVFAAVAVTFAWAATLRHRARPVVLAVIAVLMTAVPLALTGSQIGQPWVLEFAAASALALGAVALMAVRSPEQTQPSVPLRWLFGGGLVLAAACLGIALLSGSRPDQMFTSLFVFAVRFPHVYTTQLDISPAVVVWAAVLFAFGALRLRLSTRMDIPPVARLGAGIFVWISIVLLPSPIYLLALPLAWLAATSPRGDAADPIGPYCRALLPALAVLESLQAYPVAGTQVTLSGVGLLPVGAILLRDGLMQLRQRGGIATWVPRGALALGIALVIAYGAAVGSAFSRATPMNLMGAQSVRVSAQQGADLQDLVAAVDRSGCRYLITYPSMDSFYLWTPVESSLRMRYTLWYLTIGSAEQASIVEQLKSQPGLCLVRNQKLVDFWARGGPAPSGPLVDFVSDGFVPAGTFGDYELLVRASS